LLQQQKVEYLCTTDDPTDSLEHHKSIHKQGIVPKVFPTFRPDKAFAAEEAASYKSYLKKLEEVCNFSINTDQDLLQVLESRIDYFHEGGARLSDHGLEQLYTFEENAYNSETLFSNVLAEKTLSSQEVAFFKMKILLFLSKAYHKKGWTQQFHLGAIRNNNKRLLTA
jgi:glucuronate isomerase